MARKGAYGKVISEKRWRTGTGECLCRIEKNPKVATYGNPYWVIIQFAGAARPKTGIGRKVRFGFGMHKLEDVFNVKTLGKAKDLCVKFIRKYPPMSVAEQKRKGYTKIITPRL